MVDQSDRMAEALACDTCNIEETLLNRAILFDREGRTREALEEVSHLTDPEIALVVSRVKIGCLVQLGQYDATIEMALAAIDLEPRNETEKREISIIYGHLARSYWARDRDGVSSREYAVEAHLLDSTNRSPFELVREIMDKRSPENKQFKLIVEGEWDEPLNVGEAAPRFYKNFLVIAENETEALELAGEWEREGVRESLAIEECGEQSEPRLRPNERAGVIWASGRIFFSND